jgi:hypothetical protein
MKAPRTQNYNEVKEHKGKGSHHSKHSHGDEDKPSPVMFLIPILALFIVGFAFIRILKCLAKGCKKAKR